MACWSTGCARARLPTCRSSRATAALLRPYYSIELDQLRSLARSRSRRTIAALQALRRGYRRRRPAASATTTSSAITSRCRAANAGKLGTDYIHRQTMAGAMQLCHDRARRTRKPDFQRCRPCLWRLNCACSTTSSADVHGAPHCRDRRRGGRASPASISPPRSPSAQPKADRVRPGADRRRRTRHSRRPSPDGRGGARRRGRLCRQ